MPLNLQKIILKNYQLIFGSKNIINTPIKAANIKNHFFELIFSFKINALARTPKGIAN